MVLFSKYTLRVLAAEVSTFSRYYENVYQWQPMPVDEGQLLANIQCPQKSVCRQLGDIPDQKALPDQRAVILVNGNFNYQNDIEGSLAQIHQRLSRNSRVAIVAYNPYLRCAFRLAHALGFIRGNAPTAYLSVNHISNLAKLAGYEVVKIREAVYSPFWLLGIGGLINRLLPTLPVLRWFALTAVVVLRPLVPEQKSPSLTIVIPARNEAGNIEAALQRMPDFGGAEVEILFVEGHSKDNTWAEIQRVAQVYKDKFRIQVLQQTGKGKNDAVRLGFSRATGRLLTILDADLTMPPELLGRFYQAYCRGLADFINGNRLVYPMEKEAMRPLNRLGNIFFAKALAHTLDLPIGDSLCGTKMLLKSDYQRIERWRKDFGDFDPFGDFDLLFPASVLVLGSVDVPIRYLARTYGSTNISRFSHGVQLLRMTLIGFFRIKMGRVK